MNHIDLLLPGFQGHELQASILTHKPDFNLLEVTCPTSVPAAKCGIQGAGLTVEESPSSIQIINVDQDDRYVDPAFVVSS
ncbi:hypothetical protein N7468_009910 [Penicillium chermesinum]|uniref:Uncharacterized protein n=1 Tax=Penicillium chermesinum TaxID=63820 RepID=A0A9W9TBQ5_9EURO|nr:uncharacterized protein N7468_009910 [Penicillium chermesinum]KAJ5216902.1 hypothetical protein N7468_009910 [Penicillium chermesinum]